jgi:ABC-type glycerol-3-phosphate transport system substrate-binding protein
MAKRLRKENPRMEMRTQTIPWGTYYDKLTLALAYGGAPDVFVMHAGRLPEFASFETLQPLSNFYAEATPELGEQWASRIQRVALVDEAHVSSTKEFSFQ